MYSARKWVNTNYVEDSAGNGVLLGFCEPRVECEEGGPVGDVVDEDGGVGTPVEACRQSAEPFLSGLRWARAGGIVSRCRRTV